MVNQFGNLAGETLFGGWTGYDLILIYFSCVIKKSGYLCSLFYCFLRMVIFQLFADDILC